MSNSKRFLGTMLGLAAMGAGMSHHRDNPLDGPARGNCAANKTACYYFNAGGCLNPNPCEHKSTADPGAPSLVPGEKFVCDGATHTITKVDGAVLTVKPFCSYCKKETNDLRAIHNKRNERFMACRNCRRKRGMKI